MNSKRPDSQIAKVQSQFGPAAKDYVQCPVQAGDFTLRRLVDLIQPQHHWIALDVATGGGHTAVTVASKVDRVIAIDVTPQMLEHAGEYAQRLGISNISFELGDAAALPFADDCFDLVTSRLAAHHFSSVPCFLKECFRVLRPGGRLAIVDSHVPSGTGGEHINRMQRIHDPSHVRCLPLDEWLSVVSLGGLQIDEVEEGQVLLDFDQWVARAFRFPTLLLCANL